MSHCQVSVPHLCNYLVKVNNRQMSNIIIYKSLSRLTIKNLVKSDFNDADSLFF